MVGGSGFRRSSQSPVRGRRRRVRRAVIGQIAAREDGVGQLRPATALSWIATTTRFFNRHGIHEWGQTVALHR
jgi:hypothetical protein